jgi:hypothetical protein
MGRSEGSSQGILRIAYGTCRLGQRRILAGKASVAHDPLLPGLELLARDVRMKLGPFRLDGLKRTEGMSGAELSAVECAGWATLLASPSA